MGVGQFTLHQAGMETFLTALHALSKPGRGDFRTAAQRRADALISLAEIALRSGELPITGGVKPHVTIRADLATVTGETGAPAAETDFGATLSTDWVRRFTCDAEIARVVFGPGREAIDLGRTARTFSLAQRGFIVARDGHCIWPGCDGTPGWCDAHHRVHWADGGATDTDNGVQVCGRHHDRIHQYGHAIIRTSDGGFTVDLRSESDPRWHRLTGRTPRAGPAP